MFGKLIKHDMLSLFRQVRKLLLISTFFVITGFIMTISSNNYLNSTGLLLFFVTMAVQVMSVLLISLVRVEKTLYSAEGYLTHSLPVSGTQLYFSKLLSTVSFLAVMAAISALESTLFMGTSLREWSGGMVRMIMLFSEIFHDLMTRPEVQLLAISALAGLLLLYACILFSIAISNEAPFHRWSRNGAAVGVFLVTMIALGCIRALVGKVMPVRMGIAMTDARQISVHLGAQGGMEGSVWYDVHGTLVNIIAMLGLGWRTIHSLNHKISLR